MKLFFSGPYSVKQLLQQQQILFSQENSITCLQVSFLSFNVLIF